jgi:copper chaperone CopZ
MEAIKFKTNIKCTGCLEKVTPNLNRTAGEDNWEVDLQDPQKVLTVVGDASEKEVVQAMKEAGYAAERI